ncbi:MAG: hypothetical protein LBR26_09615 [Prevotella sp.]|jgi:hypothetical protein|nr:hypothetical protein [Prevotella sp.]
MKATKEQEIKALNALCEMDGYFADYFKGDIKKMVENIKHDFPIEVGTTFNEGKAVLQEAIGDLVRQRTDEIIDLVDTFLCVHEETGNERLYERAVEKLGMKNVIIRKRDLGLTITSAEIDFLLKNVTK